MQRHKIIEVVYNTCDIPGDGPCHRIDPRALQFRDKAIDRIGAALADAGLGTFLAPDTGHGEVSGRFIVDDFDLAEDVIWTAVAGLGLGLLGFEYARRRRDAIARVRQYRADHPTAETGEPGAADAAPQNGRSTSEE